MLMVREAKLRLTRRNVQRASTKSPLMSTANTIVHGENNPLRQASEVYSRITSGRSMAVNKQGAGIKPDQKGDSKGLMRSTVASIHSNRSKGKSNSP